MLLAGKGESEAALQSWAMNRGMRLSEWFAEGPEPQPRLRGCSEFTPPRFHVCWPGHELARGVSARKPDLSGEVRQIILTNLCQIILKVTTLAEAEAQKYIT
jgi:hypothetical protein